MNEGFEKENLLRKIGRILKINRVEKSAKEQAEKEKRLRLFCTEKVKSTL